MMDLLYACLILPLEKLMLICLRIFFDFSNSYGFAIILLSLLINFCLLPISRITTAFLMEELVIRKRMAPKLAEINTAFTGQERFMMTRMLYKLNNYKSFLAVRSSLGLIIQIPFFIAAYLLLSKHTALINTPFFLFDDLSQPDGLIQILGWHVNLLPIVMTAFNVVSALVYFKNVGVKNNYQTYLIPGIFLLALYSTSAALLLYWTTNNLFSLIKNIIIMWRPLEVEGESYYNKVLFKYSNLFKQALIIFVSMFIAFVLVPIFTVGSNLGDFDFLNVEVFLKTSFLFTGFFSLSLLIVIFILKSLGMISTTKFLTYFVLSFVIYAGFLFPLPEKSILIRPETIPTNYQNLFIVFGLSVLTSISSFYRFRSYVHISLVIIVLVSLGSALPRFSDLVSQNFFDSHANQVEKETNLEEQPEPALQFSNKKNIFIVSLDGMSGDTVNKLLQNNNRIENSFKDFTIFRNVVNAFPTTTLSLLSDLYGIQDYKPKGNDERQLKASLRKEFETSSTAYILDDTYQFGWSADLGIKALQTSVFSDGVDSQVQTFDSFRYFIVRIFTRHALAILQWHKVKVFRKYVGVEIRYQQTGLQEIMESIEKQNIHNWKKGISDYITYDYILENTSVIEKDISLRYFHFMFTHAPVTFDKSCKYIGDNRQKFENNQNEQGLSQQFHCGLLKLSEFVEKLKSLGIYDKSLIILKSDHGQSRNFFTDYPHNSKINGNNIWGYDRYKSFMMIKDFSAVGKKPYYEDNLVLQSDIAKTVCVSAGIQSNCDELGGNNLLSESLIIDTPYFLYVPKNSEPGFWDFENLLSVKVPSRRKTLLKVMEGSHLINLSDHSEKE